jgi:hypothetical protein
MVCGDPHFLGASSSFSDSPEKASRKSGRFSRDRGFCHDVLSRIEVALIPVSPMTKPTCLLIVTGLTRYVQIRQLDRTQIRPQAARLLGDVICEQLAIHPLEGSVEARLHVQVALVLPHLLLLLLLLPRLVVVL